MKQDCESFARLKRKEIVSEDCNLSIAKREKGKAGIARASLISRGIGKIRWRVVSSNLWRETMAWQADGPGVESRF